MRDKLFDPRLAQLDEIANEPAVESVRLQANWLRERFARPVEWQPEFTDEHRFLDAAQRLTPASVLVLECNKKVLMTACL